MGVLRDYVVTMVSQSAVLLQEKQVRNGVPRQERGNSRYLGSSTSPTSLEFPFAKDRRFLGVMLELQQVVCRVFQKDGVVFQ